jgi:outer membrane protein assembly factor BamB
MCTSTAAVERHLRGSFERLFREAPGLGGISIITAAENLTHWLPGKVKHTPEAGRGWAQEQNPVCRRSVPALSVEILWLLETMRPPMFSAISKRNEARPGFSSRSQASGWPVNPRACLMGVWLVGWMELAAQDWPQWRGVHRDGKVARFSVPAQWPKALTLKWRRPAGLGESTPALVGERLFVFGRQGEKEVVWCLNAVDGAECWRHAYATVPVTGPANKYQGPRSSPAVADGKVLTLGVGGVLTCLEAETGRRLWQHTQFIRAVPLFFTAMSPLVADGFCIVHLGGKNDGVVAAFELASGKLKWQWRGEGPSYSSPVLLTMADATQVVLLTEDSLMGLSLADGQKLWHTPTPTRPGYWNSATPVVQGPDVFYSGQGTGTRAVRIEREAGGFHVRELWHNKQSGTVYNTPVIKDGMLYALSDRGRFFCLDARTGQEAWTDTNRVSSFGTLLDAGPVLLAWPEKSGLFVFQPGRVRVQELARYKPSDLPVYAYPVVAGNRLFVRDSESVSLYWIAEDQKPPASGTREGGGNR